MDFCSEKFSYIFYVIDDFYACAAMQTCYRLEKFGKSPCIHCFALLGPNVSNEYEKTLQRRRIKVKRVEPVYTTKNETAKVYSQVLTKFRVFSNYGYTRLIYLDVDVYILKNMDHLFLLPRAPIWCAQAHWETAHRITSMLMIIEPSDINMNLLISNAQKFHYYDMDALDNVFKAKCPMLPKIYSVITDFLLVPDGRLNILGLTSNKTFQSAFFIHYSAAPMLPQANRKPFFFTESDFLILKRYHLKHNFTPLFYKMYEDYFFFRQNYCPLRVVPNWPHSWGKIES